MCDYIPLDQAVIDQEVRRLEKNRNTARALLRDACKNAGGNFDIIVFHEAHKDFRKFKSIIKALEELRLDWYEIDEDIYVNRHELYDTILPKE